MAVKISKAAFARKLRVSKAAVSRYVGLGLPLTVDGLIDPAIAAKWIEANIHVQAGSRGRGVRGAESAAVREHTRLLKLRGDRLEIENAKLAGGTSEESAERLANTIALNIWWAIQRDPPWVLAGRVGTTAGNTDPKVMHEITADILGRDYALARAIRSVVRDGISGRLTLTRGPLIGMPWEDVRPRTL